MTHQKSLFNKNLFFEDLKQNKHIMILYTIFLLLATTLPAMIMYNSYLESRHFYMLSDVAEMLSMANPFVTIINTAAAVIFVILQFGYLYKTNSVIFYHSMPITRKNMLVTKFLAGFFAMIIPILFTFMVNLSLNVIIGFQFWVSVANMFKIIAAVLLTTLFTYSVVMFAQSFCSNVFALIIAVMFIFLLYPVTKVVAVGTFIAYMPTYYVNLTLPLADYFYPMWITFSKTGLLKIFTPSFAIYLVIMPIILVSLSAIIYSKRKSENTNKFFAFDIVNKFLKYYITICLGIGFGTLIRANVNSMNIIINFVVHTMAIVVIFSILQAIFEKNIKNMFANKKMMLLVIICILVFVTIVEVDIFKIDKMVPDADKTNEIYIDMPVFSRNDYYYSSDELKFSERKSIEGAINLMKTGKISKDRYPSRDEKVVYLNFSTSKYQKWGIKRRIFVSNEEFDKFLELVFDTKEYKDQLYGFDNIYIPENGKYGLHIAHVKGENVGSEYFYIRNEKEKTNLVINTLKEEAYSAKYSDIRGEKTTYFIECEYRKDEKNGGYRYNYRQIPVFESFEKTNEVLDMFYNEHKENIQ
ncbi:MAG: ABC transporter permease [Ruminococcaceae bacterium]|nr:ABC transporter permease [Oscillospiraceae bacterium]